MVVGPPLGMLGGEASGRARGNPPLTDQGALFQGVSDPIK